MKGETERNGTGTLSNNYNAHSLQIISLVTDSKEYRVIRRRVNYRALGENKLQGHYYRGDM